MTYLLTAGCSWTDENFTSYVYPDYDTTFDKWPKHLSKKLNLKCVNVGKSGTSNVYAFDAITTRVLKQQPQKIVWQLTDWTRFNFINSDLRKHNIRPLNSIFHIGGIEDRFNIIVGLLNFLENDPEFVYQQTTSKINILKTLCEQKNIDLHICQAWFGPVPLYLVDRLQDDIEILLKHKHKDIYKLVKNLCDLDLTRWNVNYDSWLEENNIIKLPKEKHVIGEHDYHPDALGHKNIAEFLYGYVG
jgi:hypothetical protein